ncbi:MAG TPA: TonB-dependent receptor [Xanthomonadaceae bacterium]|nr:TonB-dependent receptor [Xanthomonadaceae bacterium]
MHSPRSPLAIAIALALVLPPLAASADDAGDRSSLATRLDRLNVIGSAEKAEEIAGSAEYLDAEQLEQFNYADVHRVLRQVPGVYLVDEEGFGLRPNIGIRGSGTDRNSRITVMEDGVLIAPAPYAAPAAYYFPTMARMSAVEVRKGSSAIVAGPRTTGGALNLISTPIPSGPAGLLDLAVGSHDTVLGHAWAGHMGERVGFLLETVQQDTDGFKRLDSGGDTGYRLEDYLGKFRVTSDRNADFYQELQIKIGATDQRGDETYLGLTDADFAADPYRRYAGSQVDNIVTDHEQYEIRHVIELADNLDLTTVAYRNDFARNWYKLDRVNGRPISAILADPETFADEYAWITGTNSPDNALTVRNNNRAYYARGVQSVLGWLIDGANASHELELGVRWHQDEEDRFQHDDRYRMQDGAMVLTTDGLPGTQDNRVGEAEAWAFYLQDEIRFGDLILTPGLRYERIDLTRTDYVRAPDGRDQAPTRVRDSEVSSLTPGVGATWLANDRWTLFASVHEGFNPPGPGSNADPEESINTELGARFGSGALSAELVGFHNDYSNLVGTCTASTGGECTIGDQFDGGEATVRGLEARLAYDLGRAHGAALGVPLTLAYTWTDAEFDSSFESDFEEWGDVQAGDELPFLPEHGFHAGIGVHAERWRLDLGAHHVDQMRTVASQGTVPDALLTDEAWLFDLAGAYRFSDQVELYARVENLTDEDYIASRRPAGARPGRPRSAFVGVRLRF